MFEAVGIRKMKIIQTAHTSQANASEHSIYGSDEQEIMN